MTFGGEAYSHRKLQVQVNLQDSSKSSELLINITRKNFISRVIFLLTLQYEKKSQMYYLLFFNRNVQNALMCFLLFL